MTVEAAGGNSSAKIVARHRDIRPEERYTACRGRMSHRTAQPPRRELSDRGSRRQAMRDSRLNRFNPPALPQPSTYVPRTSPTKPQHPAATYVPPRDTCLPSRCTHRHHPAAEVTAARATRCCPYRRTEGIAQLQKTAKRQYGEGTGRISARSSNGSQTRGYASETGRECRPSPFRSER